MWYLLNAYWIPLLLAGLLGVIVGWMSCNNQSGTNNAKPSWFSGWVPWGIAAAALAALAVLQTLLPGKQGLLLDTALMLFGTYMLGCCIGCILRPKPAPHLAHAAAGATKSATSGKSGTSGKAATAAAVGTAATAAGLAAAKSASSQTKSTSTATGTTQSSNVANLASSSTANDKSKINDTKAATTTSATTGVVTALGAAATGVAATAAAAASKGTSGTSAASTGDSNIKTFTGAAKFGERPELYNAPRGGGKGDELSLIWGVAEKLEHKMNATGIWHFDQIANWSQANVEWFEHEFEGFKGRLDRDKWIEQCKKLAAGWRPDGHVGQRPKV
jgi:predicted flap endonuclease-1-like 5' DNA nuclease